MESSRESSNSTPIPSLFGSGNIGHLANELTRLSLTSQAVPVLRPTSSATEQPFDFSRCPSTLFGEPELQIRTHRVPQLLFRVSCSKSGARTTENEVVAAGYQKHNGIIPDLFGMEQHEAARILNDHLWWEKNLKSPSTLVSWTNSLLYALQYAVYRSSFDRLPMNDFNICVVDTSKFPDGVFVSDRGLIRFFKDTPQAVFPDPNHTLGKLWDWRAGYIRSRKGHVLFFGEYLSQGRLDLRDRSCTVNLNAFFREDGKGMLNLCPNMTLSNGGQLANAVGQMRYSHYGHKVPPVPAQPEELRRAKEIAKTFGPPYEVGMFIHILALKTRNPTDEAIMMTCRELCKGEVDQILWDLDGNDNYPHESTLVTAPEVDQAMCLMRAFHDRHLNELKEELKSNIFGFIDRLRTAKDTRSVSHRLYKVMQEVEA